MLETVTIERKKLFQQVAVHLEGLILEGDLKPGDRLMTPSIGHIDIDLVIIKFGLGPIALDVSLLVSSGS